MNPETLHMVDELLEFVRTYSPQRDVKASELFHALVLSLFEARAQLVVGDIPPRGRWGTPTAQAFPVGLKNAFQKAIVEDYYQKNNEDWDDPESAPGENRFWPKTVSFLWSWGLESHRECSAHFKRIWRAQGLVPEGGLL